MMYSEDDLIDYLFQEWLDQKRPVVTLGDESISNRERYEDVIDFLEIAFAAGFRAKLKYNAEWQLQK